jgi:hypothetical protein
MSSPRETEQSRATPTSSDDGLEWQSELDASMAEIDSRLRDPRRYQSARATLPQLGGVTITSELLDEIARRVAEQIRRKQSSGTPTAPSTGPPPATAVATPEPQVLPTGISVTIRIRKPLFRFWGRRARRQALISFADYRIT